MKDINLNLLYYYLSDNVPLNVLTNNITNLAQYSLTAQ